MNRHGVGRGRAGSVPVVALCALTLLVSLLTLPVRADPFAVESLEPVPFVNDSIIGVASSRTLTPGAYTLSAFGAYGRKPLSIENAQRGNTLAELVGSVGTLQLMGAVGLFSRLDVGLSLPLHRISRGSEFDPAPPPALSGLVVADTKVALGDLRIVPRLRLLGGEEGFGLALLAPIYVPTGKGESYAGEPFRFEPRVSADYRSARGMLIAFNAGYLVRKRADILGARVDDMVRLGLGAELPIAWGLSGMAEIDTQLNVLNGSLNKANAPTEGLLGLRFRKAGFLAQLGAGTGIVRGIGAPRYRVLAALAFTHTPPPDSDDDDVRDDLDRCASDPEDRDGFEDEDGCPDLDNDRDGVPDALDRCLNEPEDQDGFDDADGCPDPDNDMDGVPDTRDDCVNDPEDRDGYEDGDGCPDLDNDADGVPDSEDRCPGEAGIPEEVGCPPPPPPPTVEITEEKIEITQSVFFARNSAAIDARSDALLDEVAELVLAHPELTLISVEGHSDSTGPKLVNRRLSRDRAQSVVDALVARGVARERFEVAGFGPDRPLVSNDTEEGRAQNRRVELRIVERSSGAAQDLPAQTAPLVP